jgi:diguanylate cyclase (GGDEF)-like protein
VKKVLIVQSKVCLKQTLLIQIKSVVNVDVDVADNFEEAKRLREKNDYFLILLDCNLSNNSIVEIEKFISDMNLPIILLSDDERIVKEINLNRSLIVDFVIKESLEVISYLVRSIHRIYNNLNTKVLIVDDSVSDRKFISMIVKNQMYQAVEASDGIEALEVLKDDPTIKVVITDIHMPNMGGIEFLKFIRDKKMQNELAILGVSSDQESLIRFLKLGANDFVTKPFSKREFIARLNHVVTVYEQIKELDELSSRDYLTQLRSRKYFYESVTPYLHKAYERGEECAIAMIDIDNFKLINDTYGHEVGDIVLKRLAKVLHNSLKGSDIIARYGGEEFCIFLRDTDDNSAIKVFEMLREKVENERVKIINVADDIMIKFTISIGVNTKVDTSLNKMLTRADYLLYKAKKTGKNRVVYKVEDKELEVV